MIYSTEGEERRRRKEKEILEEVHLPAGFPTLRTVPLCVTEKALNNSPRIDLDSVPNPLPRPENEHPPVSSTDAGPEPCQAEVIHTHAAISPVTPN